MQDIGDDRIKSFGPLLITSVVGLILLLSYGCSPDRRQLPDSGQQIDTRSADARDAQTHDGSDAPADAGDGMDGQSESDTDTGGTDRDDTSMPDDGGAPGHVTEEECECRGANSNCLYKGTYKRCGRADLACDADADCPEGFHCSKLQPSRCVCSGTRAECGPFCQDDSDCGRFEFCEDSRRLDGPAFCRDRRGSTCQTDASCGRGRICERVGEETSDSHCVSTGQTPVGGQCQKDSDCASGSCSGCSDPEDCTCEESGACLSDQDCPAGEHCKSWAQTWTGDGCREKSCTTSCPDNWRCLGSDCKPPLCQTTADCPRGDCIYDTRDPGVGTCLVDQPTRCKPGEIRMDEDDPYCRRLEACACLEVLGSDEEDCDVCPESYTCAEVVDPELHVTKRLCSRRVLPKE